MSIHKQTGAQHVHKVYSMHKPFFEEIMFFSRSTKLGHMAVEAVRTLPFQLKALWTSEMHFLRYWRSMALKKVTIPKAGLHDCQIIHVYTQIDATGWALQKRSYYYGLWKTWKVLKFYKFIFQAWKVMEFECWSLKVMEFDRKMILGKHEH